MSKEIENNELIIFKELKDGHVDSLEALFEQYYHPLCNFAFLFLKSDALSQEVVSELFVKIWYNRDKIKINKSVKSFLYTSTRNAAISQNRKDRFQFIYDTEKYTRKSDVTPETILLNKELESIIDNLIGGLPKMAGLVFRMKKVDGLKHKEIAQVLGISEKTVENHITKAIKKLSLLVEQNPELKKYFHNK